VAPSQGPWELRIAPLKGVKEVEPGDDLADLVLGALSANRLRLEDGDVVVVTQKAVSKSEGRLVELAGVEPGARARRLASQLGKDPRLVELVLRESRRVVRKGHGVLITETHHGFVCANSGIDQSNVGSGLVALLPEDADRSARVMRSRLEKLTGKALAVVVTDTFGRPWREGQTDVAIGASGIAPLISLRGKKDPHGYTLKVTAPAVVDEVAAAAELVMGKLSNVPVAVVRGLEFRRAELGVKTIIRDRRTDLFR
jgi:coenzyme F420-0:L-glutamate ligase / coenzyme F420-1:gamma-L-glutamate ligase